MDNSPSCLAPGAFVPRFDAYAATVRAEVGEVLEAFEGLTPGAQFEPLKRAPFGYAQGWRLVDGDGQVGQVWFGGMHAHPHVTVQGEASPAAAELLRECFPGHGLARGDVVALDTAAPGGYDMLQAICLDVARERRVKVGTAGDHLITFKGRTLYLGASSSAVRLRLYDKGEELRAKLSDPSRLAAVPAELARVELQVRPATSEAKLRAAKASPAELLGSAAWARDLAERVTGSGVEPFSVHGAWRQADHDRAYWAMLTQYGGVFRQLLSDVGSPDLVGRNVYADLARLQRLQSSQRNGGGDDE